MRLVSQMITEQDCDIGLSHSWLGQVVDVEVLDSAGAGARDPGIQEIQRHRAGSSETL